VRRRVCRAFLVDMIQHALSPEIPQRRGHRHMPSRRGANYRFF
jgi:hypothetical protein